MLVMHDKLNCMHLTASSIGYDHCIHLQQAGDAPGPRSNEFVEKDPLCREACFPGARGGAPKARRGAA